MIKEERFKLVPNEKPEHKTNHANHYVVESYGNGPTACWYKHKKEWWSEDPLDDVDIALISYFKTGTMYHETADKFFGDMQWNKYNNRSTRDNIYDGPMAFILPYLYDDNCGMGIINRGWDTIQSIKVFKYDENENKYECPIKDINEYFDTIEDLIKYVKEQMLIIRPKEAEEEEGGIMVDPWEIDEAKEVLKQAGWDDQELRYLRWIGNCRGFGACIKAEQWMADLIDKNIKDENAKSYIFDALRYANKHCDSLGFNGPQGYCGVYIYKTTEDTDLENFEEESIVRMDDGRVYILHEGD